VRTPPWTSHILCQACTSHPHPYGKWGGSCSCDLASEGAEAVIIQPTSLDRGEGLIYRFAGEVGGVEHEGEVVVKKWWWRKERTN